jgi:hypothetical protein
VSRDPEPTQLSPQEPEPRWESDIEEREARRRKMLMFGGTAAAVLFGFVGLYAGLSWIAGSLTSDPEPETRGVRPDTGEVAVASESAAAPAEIAAAPIATADDLDWYAIEAPLGHSQRLFATSTGTFYALSTAPGRTISWPPPKAIYKSGDGENWDIIPLGGDNSADDMAAAQGKLYLIGTAPGSGNFDEPAEVVVSTSPDEGDTWSTSLLPTVAGPPGGAPIQWSQLLTRIAASNDAVVAVVQSQFFLDYGQLVPAEFAGDYGYHPRADGVDVIDHRIMEQAYMTCEREMEATGGDFTGLSEDCRRLFEEGDESIGSVAFITWEEMGLPAGGEPMFSEMFVSGDGVTFEAVESPFTTGTEVSGLYALPDGFIGVESDRGRTTLWRSDDGRSWREAAALPDFNWVSSVGASGGRAVVIGHGPQGDSLVAWEDDSGEWEVIDFNELLGAMPANGERWMSSAGVGPMGVVAVFQSFDELTGREISQVALGTSPEDWSLVPIEEITGMPGGYGNWVAVGNDRILVKYDVYTEFRQLSLQVMGVSTN